MQVLTFRFIAPANDLALDFEPSARAIADVEMHGAHQFQLVIDAVRQRAPLHGPAPAANVSYTPDGGIQPLGVALGLPPAAGYGAQQGYDQGYGQGYGQPYSQGMMGEHAPAFGPGYGGAAFGMTPLTPGAPLHSTPSGVGGFNSMPSGGFAPPSFPPGAPMSAMQGYGAQVETTPFPEGMYGAAGFPQVMLPPTGYTPQSQPYGQPGGYGASPFAQPAAANPFSPEVETSPFANPYGSNPFSQNPSAPSGPSASPFAHGSGQSMNPFAAGFSAPSGASGPSQSGFSQPFPGGPSAWGGSGGYVTDVRHFADWHTPDAGPASFGSDPGARGMFGAPQSPVSGFSLPSEPSAPTFQDAWIPPDDAAEMETGALTEDAFHPHAASPDAAWSAAHSEPRQSAAEPHYDSAQERPWDAPRVSGDLPRQDVGTHFTAAPDGPHDDLGDVFDRSTAAVETPISSAPTHSLPPTAATSPTDAALSSVLVEGALLTPGKLETLRGIQSMLSTVDQPRKLGELAVMFKFLSSDQLLAALLVSRGLVSPQQIASLGRVKQERAAAGQANDLETLLVQFNMVPAEQLRSLRQELAS
jgi:hypothetical protein